MTFASFKPARVIDFLERHWRGDLSLGVAFWINGIGLNAFLNVTVGKALPKIEDLIRPELMFFVLAGLWAAIFFFTGWQLIGIWRSARNHAVAHKRRFWAVLAQIVVAINGLGTVYLYVVSGRPVLAEWYSVRHGDRDYPTHRFQVLSSGTELEFSGGVRFGITAEFEKIMADNPAIKVIHLNSPGGRHTEAIYFRDAIAARNLSTYVDVECSSACSTIFMGGSARFISRWGRLGFHETSLVGSQTAEMRRINTQSKNDLIRQGVPKAFADRAYSTPASEMWYPTIEELLAAKVVTAIARPNQFSPSGAAITSKK